MSRLRLPRTLLALGLLAVPLATRCAEAAGVNRLANPGFEATLPGHEWMPAGWDTSWSTLPTVFFGRDTSIAHEGRYAVNVANVSTLIPLWHNWSQTMVVGPETWDKDLVFTAWTRSNGVQGRGYAEAVMRRAIEAGRQLTGLTRVSLHASDAGRPLYASMGFQASAGFVALAPAH